MFVSPLLALTLPVVACVDPQKDYDDYASRTADAHGVPTITFDAGVDTGPLYAPDAGFSNKTYFMSCLTGSAAGNPSEASDFVATVAFVPASGGGGTLNFSNRVLKINPGTLSDVASDGMAYQASPMNAPVKPDGTVTMTFGQTQIPGDANPVNNQPLVFSKTTLDFHIESETQICANLDADLIMPAAMTITGPCVFRLLPSLTTPLPQLQLADYHCP